VLAGWGGTFSLASGAPRHRGNVLSEGRILAFKIGGESELPPVNVTFIDIPEPPPMEYTPEQVALGEALYHENCAVCHAPGLTASGGGVPDLRYSDASVHAAWDAIVRGGAFASRGMASFAHAVDEEGAEAIRAYVVEMTKATIGLCQSDYRKNYPELLDTACSRPEIAAGD